MNTDWIGCLYVQIFLTTGDLKYQEGYARTVHNSMGYFNGKLGVLVRWLDSIKVVDFFFAKCVSVCCSFKTMKIFLPHFLYVE